MSDPKDEARLEIVRSGKIIGTTVAGTAAAAVVSAGAANVAAAASTAHLLGLATGVFSQFAPFITGSSSPALWALIAINPATASVATVVGGAIGAAAAYKLAKKIFN